jgi:GT2 family glycosyltransferase
LVRLVPVRPTWDESRGQTGAGTVTHRPAFPAPAGFHVEIAALPDEERRAPVRVAHPDPPLTVTLTPNGAVPSGWYELELRFSPEGTIDCLAQFVHANGRVVWLRLPMIARNAFLAHLRLEGSLDRLTLILSGSGRLSDPSVCRFQRVGWSKQLAAVLGRARDIYRREGFGVFLSALSYLSRVARRDSISIPRGTAKADTAERPYDTWIHVFDERPDVDRARHEERLASMQSRPLISILAELPSLDPLTLDRLALSVREQVYPSWELLVAAPAHLHARIKQELGSHSVDLAKLQMADARPNTAENLNRLLAVSSGEYVLPLSTKALMRSHALLELALATQKLPSAEIIYCDEDRIEDDGHRDEWEFKPAWSPHILHGWNYPGPHLLMRRETVRALDGWSVSRSDAHHDLALRLTARVKPETIVHLAKLLFHRSAAVPAAAVRPVARPANAPPASRVTLIIPTRDNADMLSACIESIRTRTRYRHYDILIVDNGSVEPKALALLDRLKADPSIRILPQPSPFNFSALNNAAVRASTGEVVGFINDDIEVLKEDWLEQMVTLAEQESVGCVGAKLVYPDRRIQHGGIVLGLYGIAGHAHRFAKHDDPGYLNRLTAVQNVSAVTAACLLVRRSVFNEVGGLDERLAVAFNDVDFCLRVRAAGYLNVWTPFAELVHHESISRGRDLSPSKSRRFAGEYAMMQERWGRELLNDPYYSPHLSYDREDFSLRQR